MDPRDNLSYSRRPSLCSLKCSLEGKELKDFAKGLEQESPWIDVGNIDKKTPIRFAPINCHVLCMDPSKIKQSVVKSTHMTSLRVNDGFLHTCYDILSVTLQLQHHSITVDMHVIQGSSEYACLSLSLLERDHGIAYDASEKSLHSIKGGKLFMPLEYEYYYATNADAMHLVRKKDIDLCVYYLVPSNPYGDLTSAIQNNELIRPIEFLGCLDILGETAEAHSRFLRIAKHVLMLNMNRMKITSPVAFTWRVYYGADTEEYCDSGNSLALFHSNKNLVISESYLKALENQFPGFETHEVYKRYYDETSYTSECLWMKISPHQP